MLVPLIAALICWCHPAQGDLPAGVIAGTGQTVGYGELQEEWRGELLQLSWSPRAFYLKGFLTDEECDFLIEEAEPFMLDSKVVDVKTGASYASRARTSTSTFFDKGENDVVKRVEKRIAQVAMLPVANQEEMVILHYKAGQKYDQHHDYFFDGVNGAAARGGQRVVTVLMYLSTPDEGGETLFAKADVKGTSTAGLSDCASAGGLAVRPFKGDAVMFYGLHPDGTPDDSSQHAGCPVIRGDKWSATKWIRTGRYRRPDASSSEPVREDWEGTPECPDKSEDCAAWAFTGECAKNKQFMEESCRKSCKLCKR